MSHIITRDILNKDLTITVHSSLYDTQIYKKTELVKYINRAKTYLIKEKNCKAGQSVFIADVEWPSYIGWFFACSELGINFIISDLPVEQRNFSYVGNRLKEIYGTIDYYIGKISLGKELLGDSFSDIDQDVLLNYTDESCADIFYANPDTLLIRSMTSGTTGEPKLAFHTHKFFYDLMLRNSKVYDLKGQNKCLHTKILHHGSVLGVFFLPTLYSCSRHYWINPNVAMSDNVKILSGKSIEVAFPQNTLLPKILAKVIKAHNIDKVLLFYDMIEFLYNDINNSTKNNLTVYVLSPVQQHIVDKMVGEFNYEIVSIFGCTESSGPLFLQTVNNKNYKNFNYKNFGKPLDDFYGLNLIQDNLLEITMPDNQKILSGDKFQKVDDEFIFLGRNNSFKIKGQTIIMDLLIDFFENKLGKKSGLDFHVIFDQPNEKIFLRYIENLDFEQINHEITNELGSNYQIHFQSLEPKTNFMSGIKFDADLFRKVCNAQLKGE